MSANPSSAPSGMSKSTKGILLMVLAMFFISIMAVGTKWVGASYPVLQIVFIRNIFVLALVLCMVWRKGGIDSLVVQNRKGVALRAVFQFRRLTIATTIIFLPLADAESLFFAAPSSLRSCHPRYSENAWVGGVRPPSSAVFWRNNHVAPDPDLIQPLAFFGVAAAVFIALRDIWTRKLREGETANAIMFWSELGVLIGSFPLALYFWQPLTTNDLAIMAFAGIFLGAAQFTMALAFLTAEAATVAPFRYTVIILTTLFGYLFFGDIPDTFVIVGVAIVVASGLYILHRESVRVSE